MRDGRLGRIRGRKAVQVGGCESENRLCLLVEPAQLVLAKAHRHREDHRAEAGDRDLERDVLPYIGQPDSDDIAAPHASAGEGALEMPHVYEQLLEPDLAAVPYGGGVRTAPCVPLEVADRGVRLLHRIKEISRSGVSGSLTSMRDSAAAIAL